MTMKTLPILLAFLFSAPSVLSQENDWTVGTVLKDGTSLLYEVIPATADMIIQSQLVLYTVVVEIAQVETGESGRKRLFTTGCESGTGKVMLANMDGSKTPGATPFEWDKDGDKVFDALAVRACVAYSIKNKKPKTKGPSI